MRVLYFSPRTCWPLTTGARLRDYHLAHQLSKLGGDVLYAAMQLPGVAAESLPEDAGFRQICLTREKGYSIGKLIGGVTGPVPVTVRNFTSIQARQELQKLLGEWKPDIVQIEGVHLVEYVSTIRSAAPGAAIVSDWHNVESELMWRYAETTSSMPKRLMARRTAALIERSENKLLDHCDAHTVVSDREREKLLKRRADARVSVVPNGVDVNFYRSGTSRCASARNLLFVGSMDYHANIDAMDWFVKHVWPSVRQQHPDLRVQIVGRDPVDDIKNLASADVEVTGTVADVRPFYSDALAVIVPLRVGGGTRLKILEAMAAGIPVVSSSLGAEGLQVIDGIHVLIADAPSAWGTQIERLRSDERLSSRLITEGGALVDNFYDWSAAAKSLEEVHRSCREALR